ncbi:endonuclease/exonuclease/phosphatase family protein [Paenibacillus allorhizosphaerae]|uniref:LTD domain-containing protein n=1 Tax=Paenibacillus allorhizosphaerae TaxID=2849866 RepID=A0ABN7TLU8_9BACL|nr:endonuclease/exonuclease/phosphatase family protein [Paenibacillus allorhizosphaerae]CAG7637589.1 hypothetical protein PAECIP111802_02373 [Paenibacillus allorhizosphaerae]
MEKFVRRPVIWLAAALVVIVMTVLAVTNAKVTNGETSGEQSDPGGGPMRVMTFNLRYAAADDQPWEKRRPVMKELLLNEQPDVIGTQEGLLQQIADLETNLPAYGQIGVGREGGNIGEHMAVFYKKERVKPLEHNHFWLSDTPHVIASASWGNKIPRMVTWVRFQDLQTQKTFYFVNTHLDHESPGSREKSAQLLLDTFQTFDPEIPVILTGDFNSWTDSTVYKKLTGAGAGNLTDAFLDAKQRANDTLGTLHGYKDPTGGRPTHRIDWILYRGKINVIRGEINTFSKEGQYPSDHFPVAVDIVLQKASKTTAETVVKQPAAPALLITEVVPNSNDKGNFNYVEVYNQGETSIDLNGYKLIYYSGASFDKAKSNKWTITKDAFSGTTVIGPRETKVIWIKKQPCCYNLGMDAFLRNYGLTASDLRPEQMLAVFTPGTNQGLNGTATDGRSLSIASPDGYHLVGVEYNQGALDVKANESVTYVKPEPFISVMRKQSGNQKPTPGIVASDQVGVVKQP